MNENRLRSHASLRLEEAFLIYFYLLALSIPTSYFNIIGLETPIGYLNIVRVIQIFLILILWIRPKVSSYSDYDSWFLIYYIAFISIPEMWSYFNGYDAFFFVAKKVLFRALNIFPLYLIITRYYANQTAHVVRLSLLLTSCLQVVLMISIKYLQQFLTIEQTTIFSEGVERFFGLFAFGDGNSLALFQVYIFACLLFVGFKKKSIPIALFVVLFNSLITVAYTGSRAGLGALFSTILMAYITEMKGAVVNRKTWVTLSTIALSLLVILLIFPGLVERALFRFTRSSIETDFDLDNRYGRYGRMIDFFSFIYMNPRVLLIGDTDGYMWQGFYGVSQVVHVAFLYALQIGGVIFSACLLLFIARLFVWVRKVRAIYLVIPIAFSTLTLPLFGMFIYIPLSLSMFAGLPGNKYMLMGKPRRVA